MSGQEKIQIFRTRSRRLLSDMETYILDVKKNDPETYQELLIAEKEMFELWLKHRARIPCDHPGYDFSKHGRRCHICGQLVTDFGD